jgi:predicted dehydrogenase
MNNGNVLRVGVIGCGQIAQMIHLPYLSVSPQYRITAISDLSQKVMAAVSRVYGIPESRCFFDFHNLVSLNDIDLVLVCSTDHFEAVNEAVLAGKHVFVEKPLAFNSTQCEAIAGSARQKKAVVHTGYMKRFDPAFVYLKDNFWEPDQVNFIRMHNFGGSFGQNSKIYDIVKGDDIPPATIKAGEEAQRQALEDQLPEDRRKYRDDYSLLLGLCSHDSVLLRHLLGNKWNVLHAAVTPKGIIAAAIDFNGVPVHWESGLFMEQEIWDESISFYSDRSNYRLEFPWPYLRNCPTSLFRQENAGAGTVNTGSQIQVSMDEPYRIEWQYVHRCVCEGRQSITGPEDAALDIRFMADIIRKLQ